MFDSPVYGIIFLFKWVRSQAHDSHTPQDGSFDFNATEHGLFFAQQTIQNACATQAILSIILNQDRDAIAHGGANGSGSSGIDVGDSLRDFKDFTTGFPPELRGEALSNSDAIRQAHNAFARASPFADETDRPPPMTDEEAEDVYHFIAYVPFGNTIYELDGLQPAPINHGQFLPSVTNPDADPDAASNAFATALSAILARRVARYPPGETRFNCMAVVRDRRLVAREWGDEEMEAAQRERRQRWAWENSLRRWNFVGFTGELMRLVAGEKVAAGNGDGKAFDDWVAGARAETQRRLGIQQSHRKR